MAQSKGKSAEDIGGDWEEIQPFTEPRQLNEGDIVVAFFLGGNEVTVPAREDDKDETITTDENGRRVRTAMLWEFVENEGDEPFGLWGSAVLDKRLADVPAKSRVKIAYEGKADLEGGRTARRYRVWVDKSAKF